MKKYVIILSMFAFLACGSKSIEAEGPTFAPDSTIVHRESGGVFVSEFSTGHGLKCVYVHRFSHEGRLWCH
jgi:hypothetical protein